MQEEAVYGLTEFYRTEIEVARLVAGTGCNAATGQYILRPLVEQGAIDLDNIILDLKCAVSGAGRSLKEIYYIQSSRKEQMLIQLEVFIDIWVNLIRNYLRLQADL